MVIVNCLPLASYQRSSHFKPKKRTFTVYALKPLTFHMGPPAAALTHHWSTFNLSAPGETNNANALSLPCVLFRDDCFPSLGPDLIVITNTSNLLRKGGTKDSTSGNPTPKCCLHVWSTPTTRLNVLKSSLKTQDHWRWEAMATGPRTAVSVGGFASKLLFKSYSGRAPGSLRVW